MSSRKLTVINPFDESIVGEWPMLASGEVDAVVGRARAAFEGWRWTDMASRKALCSAFVEVFKGMADGVAADISRQMGKPNKHALGEINRLVERATYMISIAEETLSDEWIPSESPFRRCIRHEPLGVVFDIAAWNYPLLIAVNVVVPAILSGNAVILKHSSKTPLCGEAFVDAFAKAGAPKDLIQHVICDHAVTDAFVKHSGVDYVSFTGSTTGGHEIVRGASGRFVGVGLELGGKDPAYVCADANFDYAVAECVDGAFFNAGQSCCAIERVYVHHSIYDRFVDAFAALTKQYVMGNPLDDATNLGPMASKGAPAFLLGQVEDAVRRGGRAVVSAKDFRISGSGWFAAPVVVADAPQESALMQDESFGPVIGITPVHGDDEAVRFMNDSRYGLTASVWTSDEERVLRLAQHIETGTVFMNRADYCDPALAWTGVKDTGRGCSLSKYGFHQLTRLKSVHMKTTV
ncbi:MAG: gamma-aminobutyraldehyde dehydrogenase [Candidatus Hydrogenedentota bacterium]